MQVSTPKTQGGEISSENPLYTGICTLIFQAWSRGITSLTGCENRIQNERSLTLASQYFSAGSGEASAVGLWGA